MPNVTTESVPAEAPRLGEDVVASPPGPMPVDESEILDWEASIDPPAPLRSGTIRVKLEYAGRGQPLPVDDPWAD